MLTNLNLALHYRYLPNTNTYDRMVYTVQTFISQGIYVILDYQPMGTENQTYTVAEFVCKWRTLMSRVMAAPNWKDDIRGRVIVVRCSELLACCRIPNRYVRCEPCH